jgi:hypothetical protein
MMVCTFNVRRKAGRHEQVVAEPVFVCVCVCVCVYVHDKEQKKEGEWRKEKGELSPVEVFLHAAVNVSVLDLCGSSELEQSSMPC